MKQTTININSVVEVRKLSLVGLMVVMCLVAYAKPNKVDSLAMQMTNIEILIRAERQEITILEKEVNVCEKSLKNIDEHVDRVNEAVCNQIASSSHTIQVWGWIIAVIAIVVTSLMSIVGVWYARYINKLRKIIALLSSEGKRKYQQVKEVANKMDETQQKILTQQQDIQSILDTTDKKIVELQELYSDIQKNSQKIYEKLKREETIALLKRLEEIPEDITNVGDILLTRQFVLSDFEIMRNAYHNLISRSLELSGLTSLSELRRNDEDFRSLEGSYILQFAQHFMGEAIVDNELQRLLRPSFEALFSDCFFRNDAEKSTIDFKRGVTTLELQSQSSLMIDYILAISRSRYAKFEELYTIILADLAESQLEEIWKGVTKDNVNAIFFAQTIKDLITTLNPQSTMLNGINVYINNIEQQNFSQDIEAK